MTLPVTHRPIDSDPSRAHIQAMAAPAPKPPAGTPSDTADVLAAIRDLGDRMERRFGKVETDITKLDERQRKIEMEIVRLDGRISGVDGRLAGIEGQLRQIPTLYQLAGLIFAIFGAAFVLIRFASGH